jgi:hypothetical protein
MSVVVDAPAKFDAVTVIVLLPTIVKPVTAQENVGGVLLQAVSPPAPMRQVTDVGVFAVVPDTVSLLVVERCGSSPGTSMSRVGTTAEDSAPTLTPAVSSPSSTPEVTPPSG